MLKAEYPFGGDVLVLTEFDVFLMVLLTVLSIKDSITHSSHFVTSPQSNQSSDIATPNQLFTQERGHCASSTVTYILNTNQTDSLDMIKLFVTTAM